MTESPHNNKTFFPTSYQPFFWRECFFLLCTTARFGHMHTHTQWTKQIAMMTVVGELRAKKSSKTNEFFWTFFSPPKPRIVHGGS